MKVGDKVPVNIGAHEVGFAEVKEINGSEAVLIVPARRVVMGIRTELTDLPSTENGTQTIITGVDGPEASAPVGETISGDAVVSGEGIVPQPPAPVEGVADGSPASGAVTPVPAPETVATPAPVASPAPASGPESPVEAPVAPVENNGGGESQ